MFGIFAGCYNSHLVCFDQCRETSFITSSFKHVLGNLFAFILLSLSFFFLQSCVVHYFVIAAVLVFLDVW